MEQQNNPQKPNKENIFQGLKWYEHLAAGWPLILVAVAGAIGGACGGAAYFLNVNIFNLKLSNPLKYVYSFLIGVGAVVLYLGIVMIIVSVLPALFKK